MESCWYGSRDIYLVNAHQHLVLPQHAHTGHCNIQFKDLSWQQLLDIFDAEKANPGQHTIKVQVPYAVGHN